MMGMVSSNPALRHVWTNAPARPEMLSVMMSFVSAPNAQYLRGYKDVEHNDVFCHCTAPNAQYLRECRRSLLNPS